MSEGIRDRRVGLFQSLHLKEENIRFVLLALLLVIYLSFGALLFKTIEESTELETRTNFQKVYDTFVNSIINGSVDECLDYVNSNPMGKLEAIHQLLYAYGNATKNGVIFKRKRWDFLGSFHYSWTIVSTIGYGATTPSTDLGKLLVFPYGFVGCSMGLLFFNLFLERIITFLASSMRSYRQKRRSIIYASSSGCVENQPGPLTTNPWSTSSGPNGRNLGHRNNNRSAHSSTEEISDLNGDWKPSVYWVMLCLFVMSAIIILTSAALFSTMEDWTFLDSSYSSFVSYATIGFGDFVSLQKESYGPIEPVYRPAAFVLMVFGCCCIYSLLNVTSIVIKQFLNFLIKHLDCGSNRFCTQYCCSCCTSCLRQKRGFSISRKRSRSRRRTREQHQRQQDKLNGGFKISVLKSLRPTHTHTTDPAGDSGLDERRYSGENMISIGGELNNKVSLAVMQKKLYETAQSRHNPPSGYPVQTQPAFSASSVGPLAILHQKLGPE